MRERVRGYWEAAARVLDGGSAEEREKLVDRAFALLLVSAVATVKYVTGMTGDDAPLALYLVAVAGSAARGGLVPGLVATLASLVAGAVAAPGAVSWAGRLLFTVEGLTIAAVVTAVRSRLRETGSRLRSAKTTIGALRFRDLHGRLLDAALRHLEEAADDRAVVIVDERGIITEWRPAAERFYGYRPESLVGSSAGALFAGRQSESDWLALLRQAGEAGSVRRTGVHLRQDGTQVEVDLEVRPFYDVDARGFTLAVHDLARLREWDAYRQAAGDAHAAVQQAADEARRQLVSLESLTDPELNPFEGPVMVAELLERLRAAVRADGAALVPVGRLTGAVVAASGLQPVARPAGTDALRLAAGRVAVVHNDPDRVAQLSSVRWSSDASSLLVVPVVHDGQVWSTIEVVSERSRQVSDWDVALARVAADRLAAVVAQEGALAARAS